MSSSEVPIKRSLGIAFITQYAELAIGFVGVMILARIITSEEIGIYSVAAFLMVATWSIFSPSRWRGALIRPVPGCPA